MRERTSRNSTNVRPQMGAAAAPLLAMGLWWGFVAVLFATRALGTIASDVPALASFAGLAALLAYAVDRELRTLLEGRPAWACILVSLAAVALSFTHAGALLALSPVAALGLAAAATRRRQAEIRRAPAASPGARRVAP